jgi:hypothetical protein
MDKVQSDKLHSNKLHSNKLHSNKLHSNKLQSDKIKFSFTVSIRISKKVQFRQNEIFENQYDQMSFLRKSPSMWPESMFWQN